MTVGEEVEGERRERGEKKEERRKTHLLATETESVLHLRLEGRLDGLVALWKGIRLNQLD